MLKGIGYTEHYFRSYKRYIINPYSHMQPFPAISFRSPCPMWEKPHYHEVLLPSVCNWRQKYCVCQLIIPDVSTSCTLCFVYEHIFLQVNTVILAENRAWWIWILLLCIHYFLKNIYICTAENTKLEERKLECLIWPCHPWSRQVNWSQFPHL